MRCVTVLVVASVLAACAGSQDAGNACQEACDILSPGEVGVSCDPGTVTSVDTSPPNDFGSCYCAPDGTCPPGWKPHT